MAIGQPVFDPPSQDAVLERLVDWASERDAVRAMLLTSTRATPDAPTDLFSDYDVVLAVTDVRPFFEDRGWLGDFGSVLVVYRDPIRTRDGGESVAYITQYENGLKIDFTVSSVGILKRIAAGDELPDDLDVGYAVLIDKDGLTGGLPAPTHRAYVPDAPSEDAYLTLVEEFFHEATYVAKHLWRDDLLPAKYNLDHAMKQRDLRKMLNWLVETENDWGVPVRAYSKGLKEHLPHGIWQALERAYAGAGIEENWNALFGTIDLFREVAVEVGDRLGFDHPRDLDGRVCRYLEKVRGLRP
ncbi:MAG: aminoglycoside 6-adenylyltransferase [Candidatus Eisenbacteria sp.]|nr:aminoglycoside 6-adenylyltransferase [Candidatus Eisenbacteria bacterium]